MGIEDNLLKILQDPDHPDHRELTAIFKPTERGDTTAAIDLFLAHDEIESFADWCDYINANPPTPSVISILIKISKKTGIGEHLSIKGSYGANARHNQKNGNRERKAQVLAAWATGAYNSRKDCAFRLCGKYGVIEETARKWLKNSPDPIAKK
jgi:hypothetical protein